MTEVEVEALTSVLVMAAVWVWVVMMFFVKTKTPCSGWGTGRWKKLSGLFSFALFPVQPQNGTGFQAD